jgi:hypothetical protein
MLKGFPHLKTQLPGSGTVEAPQPKFGVAGPTCQKKFCSGVSKRPSHTLDDKTDASFGVLSFSCANVLFCGNILQLDVLWPGVGVIGATAITDVLARKLSSGQCGRLTTCTLGAAAC